MARANDTAGRAATSRAYPLTAAALVIALIAWAEWPTFPQDAIPFAVAGQLWVEGELDAIYGASELFVARSCPDPSCLPYVTPFLSPPPALPLAALMSPSAVRLSGVVALIWAVVATRRAPPRVRVGWALLVPFVAKTLANGQNAAWLPALVVAAVGPPGVAGVLLGLLTLTKLSPAIGVVPLVLWRRWRDLALFAAVVASAQLAVLARGGPSWWAWAEAIAWIAPQTHEANLALPWPARVVVAGLWLLGLRRSQSFRDAWIATWLVWPFLLPLTWSFYALAPATALLLAATDER